MSTTIINGSQPSLNSNSNNSGSQTQVGAMSAASANQPTVPEKKKWNKVVIGGVSAVAFAGAATAAAAAVIHTHTPKPNTIEDDDENLDETAPEVIDEVEVTGSDSNDDDFAVEEVEEVSSEPATQASTASADIFHPGYAPVAESVTDDMTFAQAFSAARQEVGPGGVFEWHGSVYGTYTADEWDSLTPDQQNEYFAQFYTTPAEQSVTAEPVLLVEEVSYDPEFDATFASFTVDGQEMVAIDIDNDGTFDYLASDLNNDGDLQDDEIIDITDEGITVNDFGGYTDYTACNTEHSDDIVIDDNLL